MIRGILKKKLVCMMATRYLRQEHDRMTSIAKNGKEDKIPDLYFTSRVASAPYEFQGDKLVWSDNEALATKYQAQVVEIAKLNKNIDKLDKLRFSPKISDYTREVIERQLMVMRRAKKIYALGKDNASFDRTVVSMNDFVQSHIVFRDGHKTFRIAKSSEDDVKRYGYTMIQHHRLSCMSGTIESFDKIIAEEKTK